MGGHIHEKNFYKDKVYYSGSFSRWIFGEEKKKGFIRFSFDKNTKEYKVKFIENKLAPLYTTINIDDIMLSDIDIEDKIKKINKIKKKYNHVRLQFNKTDIKSESDISLLKEYFLSNSDVKLKIEDVTKKIDKDDERNKELEEKYSFIFNKEYELPKILKKYIKIKNGINISEDRIKEILFHKSSD